MSLPFRAKELEKLNSEQQAGIVHLCEEIVAAQGKKSLTLGDNYVIRCVCIGDQDTWQQSIHRQIKGLRLAPIVLYV